MFLLTNRAVRSSASGLEALEDVPSAGGPNEVRIARAVKRADAWSIELLPNLADERMRRALRAALPDFSPDEPLHASHYAALCILRDAQRTNRHVLFFVHGYNNHLEGVLLRAERLSRDFNVIVVPFTWPANGGGDHAIDDACGVLSYRSDQRDARASVGALDRALCIMHERLRRLNEHMHFRPSCPLTINLLLHSMGAYLYKCVRSSSAHASNDLSLFDNVVLCAADVNNAGHAAWADRIAARHRVYITINEDDHALRLSRLKLGRTQLARLGHWPYDLNASHVKYVDFTHADHVGDSHCYFEGAPLRNERVRSFFDDAFKGRRAEDPLRNHYDPAMNAYRIS